MLLTHKNADVFFSPAGLEVIKSYDLYNPILNSGFGLFYEKNAASTPITRLYRGAYDLVVIAPATSNTVAKMVFGISDSLVTNLFTHAGKCQVPIIVLPCDPIEVKGELVSQTPTGNKVSVHVRPVDRDNAITLSKWEGVTLVNDPKQLREALSTW